MKFVINSLEKIYLDFKSSGRADRIINLKLQRETVFNERFNKKGTISRPLIIENKNEINFILPNIAVIDYKYSNKTEIIISCKDKIAVYGPEKELVEAVIRHLSHFWGLSKNWVALHACGILNDSGIDLFVGPSASGKTTIANLAKKKTVLSDETILLKFIKGKLKAYGTPWCGTGKYLNNISEKVNRIFFIKKSQKNYCFKITQSKSMISLMSEIFIPFCYYRTLPLITNICMNIILSIPCYDLHFYPDTEIWNCLKTM